ncbi:MAG: hypothetical protein VKK04_09870 [Synechococcales bacterium]|nr:hypothetical protein [Synechococcales bacterium]
MVRQKSEKKLKKFEKQFWKLRQLNTVVEKRFCGHQWQQLRGVVALRGEDDRQFAHRDEWLNVLYLPFSGAALTLYLSTFYCFISCKVPATLSRLLYRKNKGHTLRAYDIYSNISLTNHNFLLTRSQSTSSLGCEKQSPQPGFSRGFTGINRTGRKLFTLL